MTITVSQYGMTTSAVVQNNLCHSAIGTFTDTPELHVRADQQVGVET